MSEARGRGLIPQGTEVLVHGLEGERACFNDEILIVQTYRYEASSQQYVCSFSSAGAGDSTFELAGFFEHKNLQPMTAQESTDFVKARSNKEAALYDPDGPHPPKADKDRDLSAVLPLIKMLCPDVQEYSPPDACMECGKKPAGTKLFLFCGRCKMAPYCSKECQAKNWSKHKTRECTTREQRVKQLRALLGESRTVVRSGSLERCLRPQVLKAALDIAEEFVDGALMAITCTVFQIELGRCFPEEVMIGGVRQLCGIRLKQGNLSMLATKMGYQEQLDNSRKSSIAVFQKVERGMEPVRIKVLELWDRMRPMVFDPRTSSKSGLGPGILLGLWDRIRPTVFEPRTSSKSGLGPGILIARGQEAPHSSVLGICDHLATVCIDTRGDKGTALSDFLLLLDELTRQANLPEENAARKSFLERLGLFEEDLAQAWKGCASAFNGRNYVLQRDPVRVVQDVRYRNLHHAIAVKFERTHEDSGMSQRMSQRDIDKWLAETPGRWLPHDYFPGKGKPAIYAAGPRVKLGGAHGDILS